MRMTRKSRSSLQRRGQHTRLTWPTLPILIRRQPSASLAVSSSAGSGKSKTSGGPALQRKSRHMPTPGNLFYQALKAVYIPSYQTLSPLRSSDRKVLLTDKDSILDRRSEHFQSLYSAKHMVHDAAIDSIPQLPVKNEFDEPPTLRETTQAIKLLKSGKASGADGIPPDSINSSPVAGSKVHFPQTSAMQSLSLYIRTREKRRTAPTTEASPCSPSQERSWPESCSTD